MRPLAMVAAAATAIAGGVFVPLTATAAVSSDAPVVISEIYGGGGNNGAAFNRDFIELANVSDEDLDLSAYSVQYASAGGTSWQVTALTGVTLPAGEQLLIGQATGANADLPAFEADVEGTIAMSGTAGKVALVSDQVKLEGATDLVSAEQVVDFVGWGTANHFAGSGAAPGTSNATSVARDGEFTNTADNAADFTAGTPTPTGLGDDSEPEPEPTPTPTPTPTPDPEPTSYTIAEIQGTGEESTLLGETVTTTGVVTAHYPTGGFNGYVIQTPGTGGDIDLSTHTASDAIFVYGPGGIANEVALGDTVEITATVGQFYGLTQLAPVAGGAVVIEDAEAPIPANVAWPTSDEQRETLESMLIAPQGDFTVTNTYSTNQYGEVGLAAGTTPLQQPTDVARPGSAEAEAVEADNAARALVLDDGATTNFLSTTNRDLTPPYVSLTEPIIVGASVTFTEPYIVDWRNDTWKLNPTAPLVGDGAGTDGAEFENTRTEAPEEVGGDLSIAAFNVLNYFTTLGADTPGCVAYTDKDGNGVTVREGCDPRGAWSAADLERQQVKIVNAINALDADVVGLMEIENSYALGEEVDEAVATLVDALNTDAGAEVWSFVPSSADLPDVSQQDVITNAIIYRSAAVTPVGDSLALGDQSGSDQAFGNAREPIGQVFEPAAGGEPFLFVVNHFKSKGSAGPWPGDADTGDGQGSANESRVRQAEALRDWVAEVQGDVESVALVGDFNSYGFEDPLQVLYDDGYVDVEQGFELTDRTYSYSGLSGSLDHVLLSGAAFERATGADVWNINSGESVALEYSRYNNHGTLFYSDDAFRSSDHDPIKVGLSAEAAPETLTLLGINDFHGRIDDNTVAFAGTIEELRAQAEGPTLFLSSGDNIGASLFASAVAQDQPTIEVLNALGLEATAVGNHEFDRGFADLAGRVTDESDYPQLGANVYEAGTETPALPEYELIEAGDLVVGVVGVVTEETPSLVSPAGIVDLSFGDPVEALNRVAAELSDGDDANGEADVIVALVHEGAGAGTPDGATLEEEIAAGGPFAEIVTETSADVDAIFTGHTHKEYAWSAEIPGTDKTRPIVQTGSYGANIGEITLTVDSDTGEVLAHTERNVPRTETPADELIATYPAVAEVDRIVTEALAAAAEVGNTAVGEVADDITTAFSGGEYVDGTYTGGTRDDRASESTLGRTVSNMLRDQLSDLPDGAVIGVTNPGGLRADLWDTQAEFGATAIPGLPDGTISFSQANAVLPFNNTLALVTLTGEQFTTLLEQQWQRTAAGEVPQRPYLQLGLSDNVTYTFDETLPEGERITSVWVDGEPIDPAGEYRIGTFSFLASGGDNFHAFLDGTNMVDTGLLDYQAWVDDIADKSPVEPSFAKQAVQVSGVPETVTAGEAFEFTVSDLNLTSQGSPENTTVVATLDGSELGSFPVTDGAATVTVTVPETVEGEVVLELVASDSATTIRVPVTVEPGEVVEEPAQTRTVLAALLPVHVNGLLPTTLIAYVSQDEGRPAGRVEFRAGGASGAVIGTAQVRSGIATYRLGRLPRGVQTYTAVFVPDDPTVSTSSTSNRTSVLVLW